QYRDWGGDCSFSSGWPAPSLSDLRQLCLIPGKGWKDDLSELFSTAFGGELMGRKCNVCAHSRCSEIGKELQSGLSLGTIAERFRLSKTSVWRHAKRCIPAVIASADAAREAAIDDLV